MTSLEQRLVQQCWHLIAHRSEVAKAGDWLRLDALLGEVAVFNDEGEIIAFDNLCPHRGTRMFVGDSGNGRAVCPYHAWAYRDGQMRIPPSFQLQACDRERATLKRFQIAWAGDFLFVGLTPRQSLPEQLGGLYDTLADIGADVTARGDFNVHDFNCDWRVAIENALESDHVALIHGESLGQLQLQAGAFSFEGANSTWRTALGNARMAKGLSGMRRLFDIGWDFDGYTNLHIFPFAMLSSTFGYSWSLQTFHPDGPKTRFCSRLLASRTTPAGARAVGGFFESAAMINRQVFAEDAAICARVSPRYDVAAKDRIFAASEARLAHFHATLAAFG